MLTTVTTLHHLALGTRDVESLARFYRDLIGLAELTRHSYADGSLRSVWLDLGGAVLMIEPTEEAPRRVEGVAAGPFLLAFRATRGEQASIAAKLASVACTVESQTEYTTYARDPDGNRIAFSAYPIDGLGAREGHGPDARK